MKHKTLAAVVVSLIAATFLAPAIGQDPAYHVMADQRPLFGIPNALNVISNVAPWQRGIFKQGPRTHRLRVPRGPIRLA